MDNLNNIDYVTLKYNSSGIQQWVQRYNGTGNGIDWANSVAVDNSGNCFVTGSSTGSGTDRDIATVKYSSSGTMEWVRRFNGPVNSYDGANAVVTDINGNVYVAGGGIGAEASTDFVLLKYSNSGNLQWEKRFNGIRNSADVANSIAADDAGNIYITGKSYYYAIDYLTNKYNSSGDLLWSRSYNGGGFKDDIANSISLDPSGNVIVTGKSESPGSGFDFATIKYNSSGDELWVQRYNGTGNGADIANSVKTDQNGNVYVTGKSMNGLYNDFTTIKYNSGGIQQWIQKYNGQFNNDDYASSLSLDNSGNVFVTGRSKGTGNTYDFLSVKYVNGSAPVLQASISLSAVNINPGGSLNITGINFRNNTQVKVSVINSNSEIVSVQIRTTDASGSFNAVFFSGMNSATGMYTVSVYDIFTYQFAPYKYFDISSPVESFDMKFIYPSSDSVGKEITIMWEDKMYKDFFYPENVNKRQYKYKVNYTLNGGATWSADYFLEGYDYINKIRNFYLNISLPGSDEISTGTFIKFRVKDDLNPLRTDCMSAVLPVKSEVLLNTVISLEWDYNNTVQRFIPVDPVGVCADGVSRIFIKVSHHLSSPDILSATVKLSDELSSTDTRTLGKVKKATGNNLTYSSEADNANSVQATGNNPDECWFWYVSPDDFVRNSSDESKSDRVVKVTVNINYAGGFSETGTVNLSVARTPIMLVHGIGSDERIWENLTDYLQIKNKYRFGSRLNLQTNKSFEFNAAVLLKGNTEYCFTSVADNKNSFDHALNTAWISGYAANQVSYVCHSMGGDIARACFEFQAYKCELNYGKGYINRLITIDTPHNGSPLADFFTVIPYLVNASGNILSELIKGVVLASQLTANSLIKSSYKLNIIGQMESTDALRNLQSNSGGRKLNLTRVPSLLIAGDFIPGPTNNINDIAWNQFNSNEILELIDYLDKVINFLYRYYKTDYFLTGDLNSITDTYRITNTRERVFKLLNFIYRKLFGVQDFLTNGDLVVPLKSQLANPGYSRIHVFDNYNNSGSMGAGHTFVNECYKDRNILDTVMKYLNLPVNNPNFQTEIPATPVNGDNFIPGNYSPEYLNLSDTLNHITINSPAENTEIQTGDELNFNFTLDDTANLKYVSVSFQGENYTDTNKSFNYNFNILVNGNKLDTSVLEATAYYINGSDVNFSTEYIKLFVKTELPVTDFDVNDDVVNLIKDQQFYPDYRIIFSDFIYRNPTGKINAMIQNPSVISFSNSDKSFTAVSEGETFAVLNCGGKYDTLYFSVGGELNLPAVTTLISPAESGYLSKYESTFRWNNADFASAYNIEIAEDADFQNIVYQNTNVTGNNIKLNDLSELSDSAKYYWRVRGKNAVSFGDWSETRSFYALALRKTVLYLNVIPEGLYNVTTEILNKKDTVRLYLANINFPYNIIDSSFSIIDSVSFMCRIKLDFLRSGKYYIKVRHRNSIETWSKFEGEVFNNGYTTEYNFTGSSENAYGNNMKQIDVSPLRFAIYSGDVNQDGAIDAADLSEIENDAANSSSGYIRTDLTGDDFVDANDLSIAENNTAAGIYAVTP
ncbi:MAG: SBBP repeat-containing protein [Ignavibacteria bacterium]|nr:SBBP repeat-containing protein [Ignavibacteria bacterium]